MNSFSLLIDFLFSSFGSVFRLFTSHWLTGLILIISVFAGVISLVFTYSFTKK